MIIQGEIRTRILIYIAVYLLYIIANYYLTIESKNVQRMIIDFNKKNIHLLKITIFFI